MGPFIIEAYGPSFTYKLRRLSDNKVLEDTFHSNRMKEYFDTTIRTTPDPDNSNVRDHNAQPVAQKKAQVDVPSHYHAVERILEVRNRQGKREYKIKWKDCNDTTFEPEENLHPDLLRAYLKTHTRAGKKRKNIKKYKYFTEAK